MIRLNPDDNNERTRQKINSNFAHLPTGGGGSGAVSGTGTIPITGWVANTGDYPYKVSIAISGVVSEDIVNTIIDINDIDVANANSLCSAVDSYAGGITVYAKTIPTATIGFSYYKFASVSDVSALSGNGTITTTGWVSNTGDYTYKLDVAISNVTIDDIVNTYPDKDSIDVASDCQLCPVCESYNGGITFYAMKAPTANIAFSYYKVRTVIDDGVAIHSASAVTFTPTGNVTATDVQSAIVQVATQAPTYAKLLGTPPTGNNLTGSPVVYDKYNNASGAGGYGTTITASASTGIITCNFNGYVQVSANLPVYGCNVGDVIILDLVIGGVIVCFNYMPVNSSLYFHVPIPTMVWPVTNGQTIYLQVKNISASRGIAGNGGSLPNFITSLEVRRI